MTWESGTDSGLAFQWVPGDGEANSWVQGCQGWGGCGCGSQYPYGVVSCWAVVVSTGTGARVSTSNKSVYFLQGGVSLGKKSGAVTWCLWTTCPSPGDGSRGPDTAPRGPGRTEGGRGPAAGPALPCARGVHALPSSECCKLLPLSQRWVGRASGSPLPTLVTFPPQGGVPTFQASEGFSGFLHPG